LLTRRDTGHTILGRWLEKLHSCRTLEPRPDKRAAKPGGRQMITTNLFD